MRFCQILNRLKETGKAKEGGGMGVTRQTINNQ